MDAALPPDDPLHALFSGKREWIRVPSSLRVTVRGEGGPYTGRVLELSRGGVRLILEDPSFYDTGVDGFAFVIQRFPDGAEVCFEGRSLLRRVRIIRITLHEGVWLALGCQFEHPLTPGEAVTLGVAAEESESLEAKAPSLGWTTRGGRPVAVLLRVSQRKLAGPYTVAPLIAAGEKAIDLVVPGAPECVAEELAEDGLSGAVMLGRRRLWEGELQLVACEDVEANGTGPRVRLRLLATEPLGTRVHRALHVARRATD